MTRRQVGMALGGLWLLDGVLQLQPGMFTMAMIQATLQPTLIGEPAWMLALLRFTLDALSWNLPLANLTIALVQIAIGAAILWRGRASAWPYWLSLAWCAVLWPFGQGLGGLLTGGASILSGAPGSAVLYAVLTWAAWPVAGTASAALHGTRGRGPVRAGPAPAAPPAPRADSTNDEAPGEAERRKGIRLALGALLALGAGLQATPAFFTPSGLGGLATGMVGGQPLWLVHLLQWAGAGLDRVPGAANGVLVALLALSALGIWSGGRLVRPALTVAVALMAAAWVFAQAFGMLFVGMATDPNTAPLVAVLAVYVWGGRRPAREAAAAR